MIYVGGEIQALAQQYLKKPRNSGSENIMALCPFHVKADGSEERRPSFAMSTTNGLWFCHACQASGNLYTFLRDVGLTRAQIDLRFRPLIDAAAKNSPPAPDPLKPAVISTQPINESLLGVFDYYPKDLLETGYTQETLNHFEVGFDMTHVRTIYPLRDLAGSLVGLSGRAAEEVWPKYKIYDKEYTQWGLPERIGWDKRTVLWNAHVVYPQLYFNTNPSYIVVVEGFKACMWLWQAGIKNVVALLGNYLSFEHKWILERFGAEVRLFLDNNEAGQNGTIKTAEKLKKSLNLRVVEYPLRLEELEDAQPDSCTVEELQQQVHNARDYFSWRAQ